MFSIIISITAWVCSPKIVEGVNFSSNQLEKKPSNVSFSTLALDSSVQTESQIYNNNELCQFVNLKGTNLSTVANSNLKFAIEMFRSLTMENDTFFVYFGHTFVNKKYRVEGEIGHRDPSYLCGMNGKQDNGQTFVFSPYSIRALMAAVVVGMKQWTITHSVHLANRRKISYNIFPGLDFNSICETDFREIYTDTTKLMNGMSSMTQYLVPQIIKEDNMHPITMSNVMYTKKNLKMKSEYHENFTSCLKLKVKSVDDFSRSVLMDIAKNFSLKPDFLFSQNITKESDFLMFSKLNFSLELKSPFNKASSKIEDFHTTFLPFDDYEADYLVKARMLSQEGNFGFCELPKATAIEMDYKGDKLSLVIILPNEENTLYDIQPSMDNPYIGGFGTHYCGGAEPNRTKLVFDDSYLNHLQTCFKKMSDNTKKIKVTIPKFHFDQEYSLKQPFYRLATDSPDVMRNRRQQWSIFVSQDNIIDRRKRELKMDRFPMFEFETDTFLTDVFHKISFKLDYSSKDRFDGNEPATTQNIRAENRMEFKTSREFKCNRPFLFLVKDKQTGALLLSGRVTNPTNSEPTRIPKPKHSTKREGTSQRTSRPSSIKESETFSPTLVPTFTTKEFQDETFNAASIIMGYFQTTKLIIVCFAIIYF